MINESCHTRYVTQEEESPDDKLEVPLAPSHALPALFPDITRPRSVSSSQHKATYVFSLTFIGQADILICLYLSLDRQAFREDRQTDRLCKVFIWIDHGEQNCKKSGRISAKRKPLVIQDAPLDRMHAPRGLAPPLLFPLMRIHVAGYIRLSQKRK